METSPRVLTFLVGLGVEGLEIVTHLRRELHFDPVARGVCEKDFAVLAVIPEDRPSSSEENPSDFPGIYETLRVRGPLPFGESREDSTDQALMSQFLSDLNERIQSLLRLLLLPSAEQSEGGAVNLYMDIWVVGSLDESFYRRSLFPVCVAIREVVNRRFQALFRVSGPLYNASFHLMPVGTSSNLRELGREEQREVVELIFRLDRWNWGSIDHDQPDQAQESAPQPMIPRFYLLDGFTTSSMVDLLDQRRCVKNLLMMVLCTGLRHRGLLVKYFQFQAGREDILTVVTLAALEFPISLFRNYCVNHAIISLVDYFMNEQGGEEDPWELDKQFLPLLERSKVSELQTMFLETQQGENILEQIDRETPDFVYYHEEDSEQPDDWKSRTPQSQSVRLPEEKEKTNPLGEQGTYLPAVRRWEDPEDMADFFDQGWLDQVKEKLSCSRPSDIPRRYHDSIQDVGERGHFLAKTLVEDMRRATDSILGESGLQGRLPRVSRYLRSNLFGSWANHRQEMEERLQYHLPTPPETERFQFFASLLRRKIWARPPVQNLLFWTPLLIGLALIVLWPVLPSPKQWALGIIPGLEFFYTDDPLSQNAARELLPSIAQVLLAASMLVILPTFLFTASVSNWIRWITRSPFPHLAKMRRSIRQTEERDDGSEDTDSERDVLERKSVEKLERLAERDQKKMGLLGREIEELRDAFRIYWQARLQMSADLWSHRVLFALERGVLSELKNLQGLSNWLAEVRMIAIDRLRKGGDDSPESVNPESSPRAYPPETAYQAFLLENRLLPDFYAAYRIFDHHSQALETLIAEQNLFRSWRSGGKMQDVGALEAACESLFPVLSRGNMFVLSRYQDRIHQQVQDFLATLDGRLQGGRHFSYYASIEANAFVEDSGVIIVAPPDAMPIVRKAAKQANLDQLRIVGDSQDPHRIYGFRMIRDLDVNTLARYLGLMIVEEDREGHDTEGKIEDPWSTLRSGKEGKGAA
jgi:hypothetical protein